MMFPNKIEGIGMKLIIACGIALILHEARRFGIPRHIDAGAICGQYAVAMIGFGVLTTLVEAFKYIFKQVKRELASTLTESRDTDGNARFLQFLVQKSTAHRKQQAHHRIH